MRADAEEHFNRPRGLAALWFGVLGPPVAWAMHISFSHLLAVSACSPGGSIFIHGLSLLMVGVTLYAGWISWNTWREAGKNLQTDAGNVTGRSRFMALSGVILALYFTIAIVAQWIPNLFLDPCVTQ